MLARSIIFALMVVIPQISYSAESSDNQDSQAVQEVSGSDYLIEKLKIAVAWGLVPLGAEVALKSTDLWLKTYKYHLLKKLLDIHGSNIRRATSLHLTDNLSGRLEVGSYRMISDEAEKKKTIDLQKDLAARSLSTFSILSLHAQKSRKTWYRLLDITDMLASSASLALSRGDERRAAALIAFVAQLVVYIHPEYRASDASKSIHNNFSHYVHWDQNKHVEFRSAIVQHLSQMDPLYKQYSSLKLRYCDLLSHWLKDSGNCKALEKDAIDEIGAIADEIVAHNSRPESSQRADKKEGAGKNKGKPSNGISADHIRNSIFVFGVIGPGTLMYFAGEQNHAVDVLVKHLTKVVGFATTKANMERFASQSRRQLENWGAIDTGRSVNRSSGLAEYANLYFSTLQKNAVKILAEQPNFARSNIQRAIEALVIHFSDAYRQPINDDSSRAAILASALIHTHKEIVELKTEDTLIRSAIMAYQPFENSAVISHTRQSLSLRPNSEEHTNHAYDALLEVWAHLSRPPKDQDSPTLTGMFTKPSRVCTAGDCPASQAEPEEHSETSHATQAEPEEHSETSHATQAASWFDYLPDFNAVKIQGVALGYSTLMAIIKPYTIDRFSPKEKTNTLRKLATYYFLASMIDFGLRSIGEPAIVHLQTVIKNLIGTSTGILPPEDAQIQSELAAKVNDLNRKLSIEAQTSRSYKMTCEALLLKGWSLAAGIVQQQDKRLDESAAVIAYTAYIFRYLHPEFEADDKVISALAYSRLNGLHQTLTSKNQMAAFSSLIFTHLVQLDPHFSDPVISKLYKIILKSWGLDSDSASAQYAEDVLNSWAVYGDWLLGAGGFLTQALIKAAVHEQNLIVRAIVNFAANIFEYGTTDPLRKKIYALSRLKMLNLFESYEPSEQMAADNANKELTNSFRRQKFYFGKLEMDMRTQLVQLITSIISSFSEARIYLDAEEDEKAVNLIALSLVRLTLFAPDVSGDDEHIARAIKTQVRPFQHKMVELNASILAATSDLLRQERGMTNEIYEEATGKVHALSMLWME